MLKKLLLLVVFFLTSIFCLTRITWLAQAVIATPTPSAAEDEIDLNASASPSSEATQNLKERIEKVVEEKKEDLQKTLLEMAGMKKAYLAQIDRVSEETITVKAKSGTKIIPIDDQFPIYKKGVLVGLDSLAVGDWIIVFGEADGKEITPKKIYIAIGTLNPKPHNIVLGTIKELSKNELQIQSRSQADATTFTINSKTKFEDSQGEAATAKDFFKNMQCVVVGYVDESDKRIVTTVRALAPLESKSKEEKE